MENINIKEISDKYNSLSEPEKQEIYDLYYDPETRQEIKNKLKKIIFYKEPPTIEEFLDPKNGWLSNAVIQSTFPHIIQELKDIFNPDKTITKVVLYGSTRQGKTYLARLMILYTIVYVHHLREPAMFYGLSPLTRLCIYFISYKFDKTRQLYLDPMYEIMRQSSRFKKIKFQDKVKETQDRVGRDTIVWSKAAESGEITLASGLLLQLGNSDVISAIGADPLQCYISEISFFIEFAGTSEESIFELYTNITTRIYNTVRENYLAFVYLDTSANDAESVIEKHIIQDLQFREKVHFRWRSLWEARPNLFPEWQKTGKTFQVCIGNGTIDPFIVDNNKQLEGIPNDLIINVPIDAQQFFKDNLIKEIKDIAGRPTQRENKFIPNSSIISIMFSNSYLQNIEGSLTADYMSMPEQLLWNQVRDLLFHKNAQGSYTIKRAPSEYRYIAWDNAYSLKGDVMGFCIKHKEWSQDLNQIVYVNDLCCIIRGTDAGINLDAPKFFVLDLITYAHLPIYAIYSDTFESESQKQFLERNNIKMIKQSVDRTLSPYQYYLTCLNNQLLKSGKNIFLKNNLNCLVLTKTESGKEKVDHPIGSKIIVYNGDWDTSTAGHYAKDCSDADCNALWGAYNHNYIPQTIYEHENKKFSTDINDLSFLVNIAKQDVLRFRNNVAYK